MQHTICMPAVVTAAQWIIDESQVVTLTGTADLENRVIIEVDYSDLDCLKEYMEKAEQAGEE